MTTCRKSRLLWSGLLNSEEGHGWMNPKRSCPLFREHPAMTSIFYQMHQPLAREFFLNISLDWAGVYRFFPEGSRGGVDKDETVSFPLPHRLTGLEPPQGQSSLSVSVDTGPCACPFCL